ncbi:MAG: sigma-70 family RNA polymerase sigma factor [Planctomycetota bacterium]
MNATKKLDHQVREHAQRLKEVGVAALNGLFDLTAQRLVRLAVTITRNQHDGEDAVQAALLRVANEPGLLSNADYPWAYLLRMVRNEALLVLRRKKRAYPLANLSDLITHCTVDQAEREEQFQAVWKALRKLPSTQSEVVVLKIWEGLTFSEIGSVLDISPSTAASRYRYALEKLARKLNSIGPVESEQATDRRAAV